MDSMVFSGQECYISVPMSTRGAAASTTSRPRSRRHEHPGQSQYIGNLAAGTGRAPIFGHFPRAGECRGEVVVTYEDAT
jgi:hypothetical protein